MSSSTKDDYNFRESFEDEDEMDVFSEVQRNTIVKMYSKEKAALYLFGRDRNKLEGTAVNNDDLAIIGTSDRSHDEGGPKGTISTESTSLSTPSRSWHGRSSTSSKISVEETLTPALPVCERSRSPNHSRQGVELGNLTDHRAPAELTGSTETAALQDSKKMAFERMILQHVSLSSETLNPE